jgi:chromate reductase
LPLNKNKKRIMQNILCFAGSNSKKSINKQLANYTASAIEGATITSLDLNDFEMPLFGVDIEAENGIPEKAHAFIALVGKADGIILSLAEHNSSFSAAYKNLYDWVSRANKNFFQDTPLFLMATSPGGRGGKSVLEHATAIYERANKAEMFTFSLPSFNANFSATEGVTEPTLKAEFESKLEQFKSAVQAQKSLA